MLFRSPLPEAGGENNSRSEPRALMSAACQQQPRRKRRRRRRRRSSQQCKPVQPAAAVRAGPQSAKVPLASLQQPNGGMACGTRGVSSCAVQGSTGPDAATVAKLRAEVVAAANGWYKNGGPRFWYTSHSARTLDQPLYKPSAAEEAARMKELHRVIDLLQPGLWVVRKELCGQDRPEKVFTFTFKL